MQAFANLPIRTARLDLRPLREADVAALFEIHSDPKAMRYWDASIWQNDERGRAMVARDLALTTKAFTAFAELNLNRVEADTDPRNQRTASLLDRLRFSKEGLFRERCIVDGEISDAAMYGLLRREWNQKP